LGSANGVSFDTVGVEVAFQSLHSETLFYCSLPNLLRDKINSINGLVWMGEAAFMKQQIEEN
jgi:hypothetical protein